MTSGKFATSAAVPIGESVWVVGVPFKDGKLKLAIGAKTVTEGSVQRNAKASDVVSKAVARSERERLTASTRAFGARIVSVSETEGSLAVCGSLSVCAIGGSKEKGLRGVRVRDDLTREVKTGSSQVKNLRLTFIVK